MDFQPWSRVISFADAYEFTLGFLAFLPQGRVELLDVCMCPREAVRALEKD